MTNEVDENMMDKVMDILNSPAGIALSALPLTLLAHKEMNRRCEQMERESEKLAEEERETIRDSLGW